MSHPSFSSRFLALAGSLALAGLILTPGLAAAENVLVGNSLGSVLTGSVADQQFAPLASNAHATSVYALAVNGDRLLSGDNNGNMVLWDMAAKAPKPMEKAHKSAVRAVRFSPDGSLFASASKDRTVIVWDAATLAPKATLEGHGSYVYGLDFSPDGKFLASVGSDNKLFLWDAATWKPVKDVTAHYNAIYEARFSPDGALLATCGLDKLVKLWNAQDLSEVKTFEGHAGGVFAVTFSRDGATLVSAGADKTVRFWDVASGGMKKVVNLPESVSVNSLVLDATGQRLYAGDDSGQVVQLSMETLDIVQTAKVEGSVKSLVVSN